VICIRASLQENIPTAGLGARAWEAQARATSEQVTYSERKIWLLVFTFIAAGKLRVSGDGCNIEPRSRTRRRSIILSVDRCGIFWFFSRRGGSCYVSFLGCLDCRIARVSSWEAVGSPSGTGATRPHPATLPIADDGSVGAWGRFHERTRCTAACALAASFVGVGEDHSNRAAGWAPLHPHPP
jgi:hypothetical protein